MRLQFRFCRCSMGFEETQHASLASIHGAVRFSTFPGGCLWSEVRLEYHELMWSDVDKDRTGEHLPIPVQVEALISLEVVIREKLRSWIVKHVDSKLRSLPSWSFT